MLLVSSTSLALNDPKQEMAEVIEDYVVAKYPAWAGLDIQITFKYAEKLFRSLEELEGEAHIKVLETYKDLKPVGNVIIPMEVTAEDFSRKVFVRAKVEVFKGIVVADRLIKRGEEIQSEDLKLEERDIALLPQKYFESLDQIVSAEAKTTIPKNSTLFEWMAKKIPLIRRGDKVTIRVSASSLLVKSEGVALSDGYLGKKMTVKRKDIKKSLEGIVVSANEVEVKLK